MVVMTLKKLQRILSSRKIHRALVWPLKLTATLHPWRKSEEKDEAWQSLCRKKRSAPTTADHRSKKKGIFFVNNFFEHSKA